MSSVSRYSSTIECSRTEPTLIGRKPDGMTSPRWEMNMMPLPSRMPKPREAGESRISCSVRPARSICWAAMRRYCMASVVLMRKGASGRRLFHLMRVRSASPGLISRSWAPRPTEMRKNRLHWNSS